MLYESWTRFSVTDTDGFDRALIGLERIAEDLPAAVQKAIENEIDHLAAEAKAKLLAQPVHGHKQTGVRERIIEGLKAEYTDGGGKLAVWAPGDDMGSMPRGFDVESKGWRHPVFGNENHWVQQKGTNDWWFETMKQAQPDLDEKLPEVMEEVVKETFGE